MCIRDRSTSLVFKSSVCFSPPATHVSICVAANRKWNAAKRMRTASVVVLPTVEPIDIRLAESF
eukprot:5114804-Alexandrium_andersonii.AAC.1